MKTVLAVAAILFAGLLVLASPPDVPLKPGKYVIMTSVEMNGRPLGGPTKSNPRCLWTRRSESDPLAARKVIH